MATMGASALRIAASRPLTAPSASAIALLVLSRAACARSASRLSLLACAVPGEMPPDPPAPPNARPNVARNRSEEHTSELQSLMRNSYAVFCLKKKKPTQHTRIDECAKHK